MRRRIKWSRVRAGLYVTDVYGTGYRVMEVDLSEAYGGPARWVWRLERDAYMDQWLGDYRTRAEATRALEEYIAAHEEGVVVDAD